MIEPKNMYKFDNILFFPVYSKMKNNKKNNNKLHNSLAKIIINIMKVTK